MSQEVGIIEFGSQKITVIIAKRGINSTFDIKGISRVDYAGFYDGDWLEPEKLREKIKEAIVTAEANSRTKIRDLFVGVPGEFTTAITKDVSLSFRTKQRLTNVEVDQLYELGDTFSNDPEYLVINRSSIYYMLDDNKRLIDPIGIQSSKMAGKLSYILAERVFLRRIETILSEFDYNVEYISSVLAEALFLFEPDIRDRYALLCDVGYLTTNVALIRGDGILYMKSFSMGGGHIEMDLAECLHISFEMAVALKRQVALSLDVGDMDKYDVETQDGITSFSARLVHEIVAARIENISVLVSKCLEGCQFEYPRYLPIYLTGGGVSYIRGAKELMSAYVGKNVERYERGLPQYSKPHELAEFGLLDIALKNVEPKRAFFGKFFKN